MFLMPYDFEITKENMYREPNGQKTLFWEGCSDESGLGAIPYGAFTIYNLKAPA